MATNIIHKKSSVAGKQPNDSSDLVYGELAINYHDGYLYYKDTSNTIRKFMDSAKTQGLIDNELNSFVTPTARAAISVVSNGTDGSLAYNNSTGVITYTGIIDSDYVDEVFIMINNETDSLAIINGDDRLAQCILEKNTQIKLSETKTQPAQKTDRDGGFGSTGKN